MTGFGVYLHVPFCRHRCDYCAFATWTDRDHLVEQYLAACRTHASRLAPELPRVTSVFVGGGTPSACVAPDLLLAVLAELPIVDGAEVTVECNPEDLDGRAGRGLRRRGRHPHLARRPVDGAPRAGLARPPARPARRWPRPSPPPGAPGSTSTST